MRNPFRFFVPPVSRNAIEKYLDTFELVGNDGLQVDELTQVGVCTPFKGIVGSPTERRTEELVVGCTAFMRKGRTADIWLMISLPRAAILTHVAHGMELWIPLGGLPATKGTRP